MEELNVNQTSLKHEEIIKQVKFITTDEIFNGNTKPIFFRFLVGLLRAHWEGGAKSYINFQMWSQICSIIMYVLLPVVVIIDCLTSNSLEIQVPYCPCLRWRRCDGAPY